VAGGPHRSAVDCDSTSWLAAATGESVRSTVARRAGEVCRGAPAGEVDRPRRGEFADGRGDRGKPPSMMDARTTRLGSKASAASATVPTGASAPRNGMRHPLRRSTIPKHIRAISCRSLAAGQDGARAAALVTAGPGRADDRGAGCWRMLLGDRDRAPLRPVARPKIANERGYAENDARGSPRAAAGVGRPVHQPPRLVGTAVTTRLSR
jgi:hypothetical protein